VSAAGAGLTRVTPKELEAWTPRSASHARILALVVRRGAHRQIEVMDTVTGQLTPVTRDPVDHWNPSLSSDGRFVTWHQAPTGSPRKSLEPAASPPGTHLAMLRVEGAFPAFSPDGKRLALTSGDFGGLDLLEVEGGNRRRIYSDPPRKVFAVAWSRGSDRLAFSSGPTFQGPGAPVDLVLLEADGSGFRKLTSESGNNAFPSFSPDGERLVFRSGREGAMNLFTIKADGSDLRRLTTGRWTDTMPDWSPAGDQIAFASNREGEFEIWLVKPDGANLRKLVGGGGRNNHPHFSPDGKWIVFASQRAGYTAEEISLPHQPQPYGDLFAIRLDGEGLVRLTHSPFEEGTPAWGPAAAKRGSGAPAGKSGD
jgi:Tol biopolymer transport system component